MNANANADTVTLRKPHVHDPAATAEPKTRQAEATGEALPKSASPSASPATIRNCNLMKMFFLDHYFDLLTYIDKRKQRLGEFKSYMAHSELSEEEATRQWASYCGRERAHLRKRRTRMRLSHFQILKQVGQGGYGQVFLARKKDSQELCALKRMNKKLLQKMGEVQHILTERDILARSDSPWLVKLLYAFQDMDSVYLAMEYVPGGDFRTLLNLSGVLREQHARVYFAEMCSSVFALHRFGYIHRDLKPENFLIDATGHIKLTDFGLSRGTLSPEVIESLRSKLEKLKHTLLTPRTVTERFNTHRSVRKDLRAFTLVGSPDYMAPEVLVATQAGYDFTVDYWSLGCILFECLAGYPPFTAKSTDDVWLNVYHWKRVLERPVYVGEDEEFNLSDPSWDLITHLIASQEDRYKTPEEIQRHPFLGEHINLELLRTPQGPKAPLVPQLASPTDTSYFDNFDDPEDMARYKEVHQRQDDLRRTVMNDDAEAGRSSDEARGLRTAFVGFTFRRSDASMADQIETLV
ncbi:kinase-like domain-containing protein [Entophlyctis helioformis]|nr:kinase-like domain-containing protein [Entophlyctis helioformis]